MQRVALLFLLLLSPTIPALAQGTCTSPSPDCVVVGEWDISFSLGAGVRTNPLGHRSDIPLVALPHISYYGKRFFLENLDVGFTLYENDTHTFNIVGSPGYDRVFFHRDDLQNVFVEGALSTPPLGADEPSEQFATHTRHSTYLVGPEWTFGYGRIVGQLHALREVTGRHDGYEVRAAMAMPLLQNEHSLSLSAGGTWKSRELVRYYYGIERLYEPGSAFSPFIKLNYLLPLTERWSFTAFAHYEYLDGAIAHSPLLSDHHVVTAFAGFNFKLL